MTAESTKECRRCAAVKPLGDFYRHCDTRDGRGSYCKDCLRAKTQEWRARNPELVAEQNARTRQYRAENPGKYRVQQRKWREANQQANLARSREWKAKNVDRVVAYNRAWAKEHPEYYVAQTIRRRHSLGRATSQDLSFMAALRHDPCSYCGSAAGTIDHIEPLHHGGSGHWSNLTASCRSCNASKSTTPLIKFLLRAA